MMNLNKHFLQLTLSACITLASVACSDNTDELGSSFVVNNFRIIDYGNAGNSLDLRLTFEPGENRGAYRLILVPDGSAISTGTALALPVDSYYSIDNPASLQQIQVDQEFMDVDGNIIENHRSFDAYILTVNDKNDAGILSESHMVELADVPFYDMVDLASYPTNVEALTYHPDGYILCPGQGRLYRTTIASGVVETLETFPGDLPLGGALDQSDNSYFLSLFNSGQVLKYDQDFNNQVFVSGISGPTGITVDNRNQDVYVANYNTGVISRVTTEGNLSSFASSNTDLIFGPDGLVFADGELFMANFLNGKIARINSDGVPSLFTEIPGDTTGYIKYHEGFFFIPSLQRNTVYTISKETGEYRAIAGTGLRGDSIGPALLSNLNGPNGIEISPSGDTIFVTSRNKVKMLIRRE